MDELNLPILAISSEFGLSGGDLNRLVKDGRSLKDLEKIVEPIRDVSKICDHDKERADDLNTEHAFETRLSHDITMKLRAMQVGLHT